MLIDDVAIDPHLSRHPEHAQLVADLEDAHAFSLSEPFSHAADELKEMNPSSMMKILGLFRLPFPICWLEVPQAYRPSFLNGTVVEGTLAGVKRIGILMRQENCVGPIEMDLFWSFNDGAVYGCRTNYTYRPGTDSLPDFNQRMAIVDQLKVKIKPSELEAALAMERIFHKNVSRYRRDEVNRAAASPRSYELLRNFDEAARKDWAGETRFWISALALMNSRNVYAEQIIDNTKLNAARKKKGKRPFFSMVECILSERITNRMSEGQGAGGMRSHFVRGHFKARSSGIFWWQPFLRGDQSLGFVEKKYRVA